MKLLSSILFFFISLTCFSASIAESLKTHADTTPVDIKKRHSQLSSYLAEPCESDREKVIIFSYWIAKNIRYDLKEVKSNKRNKIAREVLENRKAVCGGYSALFDQFCENENIPSFYVVGTAWGGILKKTFAKKSLGHGWNAVFVDGQWQLIDVTWCTDIVKTSAFKKSREMEWIFMDPVKFSETHLPEDPRWQLRNDPNSAKEFWKKKELEKREYNIDDSLAILSNKQWHEAELISIKGAYVEHQDPSKFIKDMNRLGFDLVGGFYDSLNCERGKIIFKEIQVYSSLLEPFKDDKNQKAVTNTGLWLADRRLEMKE